MPGARAPDLYDQPRPFHTLPRTGPGRHYAPSLAQELPASSRQSISTANLEHGGSATTPNSFSLFQASTPICLSAGVDRDFIAPYSTSSISLARRQGEQLGADRVRQRLAHALAPLWPGVPTEQTTKAVYDWLDRARGGFVVARSSREFRRSSIAPGCYGRWPIGAQWPVHAEKAI